MQEHSAQLPTMAIHHVSCNVNQP